MFLPVACLKCGKLFQVPEAAAGAEVPCPWCKSNTPALPVAGLPKTEPVANEPLSLDEDPSEPASPPTVKRKPKSLLFNLAIGFVLTIAVLTVTIAVLRFGSGNISPIAWSDFTPPDGSCTISLPGQPEVERIEPSPTDSITRGLEQYTTSGWYSRTRVWFGWHDLDAGWVKVAKEDKNGAVTSPVLAAERDKRKNSAKGSNVTEATVRFGPHIGLQVQMDTPKGRLVEWYVLVLEGPRPRLYFMGLEAKNAAAEGAAAQKLFNSFRVN